MSKPTEIRAECHHEIGSIIQRDAGRIIAQWEARASEEQPTAKSVRRSVLLDHFPGFLSELGRSLAEVGDEELYRRCRSATIHGDQRWETGWSIDEVVRDYQLLRLVIVEYLQDALNRRLSGSEVMALGLFIDDAIGASVTAYVACQREEASHPARADSSGERAAMETGELFGMLGHELRNSLAPLATSLYVLQMAGTDADTLEKACSLMGRQIKVMTRLVEDLMDVPRLTRGKVSLKTERIDLCCLVRESVEDQLAAFREAGIELCLSVPTAAVWTAGDATRLRQVIGNLLSNALKFTHRGGRVSVSLQAVAELGTARLCVIDDGVGIDSAALPNIFEAFNQADRSIDRERGGLGLGLALVEGLVELHGGRVTAKSAGLGSGSEFMVELPVYDHLSETTGSDDPTRPTPSSRQRIVLIDDNRDLADSTRMVLELSGHQVHVAYTGHEGVAAVRRLAPQVIICDIGLPGMSGYDVCRQICQDADAKASLKIALSGHGSNSNKELALQAGFDLFLLKPVDPQQVATAIADFQASRGDA